MSKSVLAIVVIIFVYVVSTGASYALFSNTPGIGKNFIKSKPPTKSTTGDIVFDDNLPRTEVCPLNGAKYSKQQKDWWESHRPLGVMIENHDDSRPQSGLGSADVVYEAVAEGGITRFLAVFYCQDVNPIGPVRSARTYFLDWISEYGESPLYAHVGGANTPGPANALGQIEEYGWNAYNDLNQFSIGYPAFWRDYDRLGAGTATEHTMYSATTKLWDFAKSKRKLSEVDDEGTSWDETFEAYAFKDDAKDSERGSASPVHLEFWDGYKQFFVDWEYDKATNTYKRKNGGVAHLDKNNGKQITAKNVVVMLMRESNANDGYENNLHLLYKNEGTGKATIFMDGKEIKGSWNKKDRTSRTMLNDSNGDAIELNRGTIWFEILPLEGVVSVK